MQSPPVSRMRLRPALFPLTCLCAGACLSLSARAEIAIKDRRSDAPIVLNQPEDYLLKNVRISGLTDGAALTLEGRIKSVSIENSKFGDITAGGNNVAAAMTAVNATVGSFKVTDSAFYDAENQLVSLREGSFGTVTFMHCTFKTSDTFLKKIYTNNPWRHAPPTTEFYNIDRLELLDNEFSNTTIVIHPSVKMVVFRGDISKVRVESLDTQVIVIDPTVNPATRPSMPSMPSMPATGVYASAAVPMAADAERGDANRADADRADHGAQQQADETDPAGTNSADEIRSELLLNSTSPAPAQPVDKHAAAPQSELKAKDLRTTP